MKEKLIGPEVLLDLNDRMSDELIKYQKLFYENQFKWREGMQREIMKGANTFWEMRIPLGYSEEGIYCKLVGQVYKFRKPPFRRAKDLEAYLETTDVVKDMRSKANLELKVFMGGERHMGYVYYIEFILT